MWVIPLTSILSPKGRGCQSSKPALTLSLRIRELFRHSLGRATRRVTKFAAGYPPLCQLTRAVLPAVAAAKAGRGSITRPGLGPAGKIHGSIRTESPTLIGPPLITMASTPLFPFSSCRSPARMASICPQGSQSPTNSIVTASPIKTTWPF